MPPPRAQLSDTAITTGVANDIAVQERRPPHNLEAEKGLLGAILLNNRAHEKIADTLRPEHFAYERHGQIFEAIDRMIAKGRVADGITLHRYFEGQQTLAEIGGAAYLAALTGAAASVANAAEYGRIVHDLYLKRELISVCEAGLAACYAADVEASAPALMDTLEADLFALGKSGAHGTGPQPFSHYLDGALSDLDHAIKHGLQGVETGLADLDKILTPLTPGLYVLAGRPAMGKTALAWSICIKNAIKGKQIAFFSQEMPGRQIAQREVSARSGHSMRDLQRGHPTPQQFTAIRDLVLSARDLPIHIDETGGLYTSQIRERARRLKRKKGLDLIVIDYLQLMQSKRRDGRTQEISEITRQLKQIALELAVPILALSQLSRNCESRENKRPILADLRESGSIEQDADAVLMIYRDHYYLEKQRPQRKEGEDDSRFYGRQATFEVDLLACEKDCEVSIAKQRNGPTGTAELYFERSKMMFADKANGPDGDGAGAGDGGVATDVGVGVGAGRST